MLILEGMMDFPEATVYRDDATDVRFYTLPKVPVFRREGGKAVFRFAKYRTLKDLANGERAPHSSSWTSSWRCRPTPRHRCAASWSTW